MGAVGFTYVTLLLVGYGTETLALPLIRQLPGTLGSTPPTGAQSVCTKNRITRRKTINQVRNHRKRRNAQPTIQVRTIAGAKLTCPCLLIHYRTGTYAHPVFQPTTSACGKAWRDTVLLWTNTVSISEITFPPPLYPSDNLGKSEWVRTPQGG